MSRTKLPKRRLLTRTRLANEMGMTVPALKKHLVSAGILDASGRMPSIVAYLKGAVVWRVMAADAMARFFVLDAEVVKELAPDLADAGDRNHVRSRHAAATLLGQAANELASAVLEKSETVISYTASIGWLMFDNWECTVPSTVEEKREFALRLEGILSSVDAEIAAGLIDGSSDVVPPARETILAVIAWYRGDRRSTGRPSVSALASHPIPVRVLDERVRASNSSFSADGVSVALSPGEFALLSGGHTFRTGAAVSGAAATAIEKACALMAESFASPSNPYSPCDYFRMSLDQQWIFACPGSGTSVPWVFPASLRDGLLTVSPCGDAVPSDEFERLGLDVDDGLIGAEYASAVVWHQDVVAQ